VNGVIRATSEPLNMTISLGDTPGSGV